MPLTVGVLQGIIVLTSFSFCLYGLGLSGYRAHLALYADDSTLSISQLIQ